MTTFSLPGTRALRSAADVGANVQAFREAVSVLIERRDLIVAMARRDLGSRYAGQMLGMIWAVVHPLFQMALFVFVFGVVFQQRIGGTYDLPRDYTVYILTGLAAWLSLGPVLSSAANSVVGNGNLIKQFTFDARILPVKDMIVVSVVWLVSVSVVVLYTVLAYFSLPWTYLLIPVVVAVHALIALGWAWAIAAIAAFFRDLKDVITLITTAMMYVLPIVYLPNWIPAVFKPVIYLNPFSYLIWIYQDTFYFGRIEHPWAWPVALLFGLLSFTLGYRLFRRLQPMFGSSL